MPDIDVTNAVTVIEPGVPATATAEEKLDAIKAELAALDELAAPIVAADILDALARIKDVI